MHSPLNAWPIQYHNVSNRLESIRSVSMTVTEGTVSAKGMQRQHRRWGCGEPAVEYGRDGGGSLGWEGRQAVDPESITLESLLGIRTSSWAREKQTRRAVPTQHNQPCRSEAQTPATRRQYQGFLMGGLGDR